MQSFVWMDPFVNVPTSSTELRAAPAMICGIGGIHLDLNRFNWKLYLRNDISDQRTFQFQIELWSTSNQEKKLNKTIFKQFAPGCNIKPFEPSAISTS